MKLDPVWVAVIAIIANVVMAIVSNINQWLIARYNKKREVKLEEATASAKAPVKSPVKKKQFWTSRKFALLQFLGGAASATSALLLPSEYMTLQMLSLAIGVSAMFSAFPSDVGGELAALIDRIVDVIQRQTDAARAQLDAAHSHSKWNGEVFRKIIENEKLVASQIGKIVRILESLDIPADKQAAMNEIKGQLELYAQSAAQLPQEKPAQ